MREKLDGTGNPIDPKLFYYIQDTRQIVGNCAMWWRHQGKGYTCELNDAGIFKGSDSSVHSDRDSDRPWLVELVRPLMHQHVTTDSLHKYRPA